MGIKDLIIEEGTLHAGRQIAERWEREGIVDTLVVRGPTATLVEAAIKRIPVIRIDIPYFDFLEAFYRARKIGNRIAVILVGADQSPNEMQYLGQIAGVEITPLTYANRFGYMRQLLRARQQGYDTIVSIGPPIIEMARQLNMHGVLVETRPETLRKGLRNAMNLLQHSEKEKQKAMRKQEIASRSQTILDLSSDGVISVDREGTILVINHAAERILGVKAANVIGRNRLEFAEHPALGILLSDQIELRAELLKLEGKDLVVNRSILESKSMVITFQVARHIQVLEEKIRVQLHNKGLVARYKFADLVGQNPSFQQAKDRGAQFAQTDFTVLITGESGTGKELFAHAIHRASKRATGPFVAINCAALPDNLLESELFGYEEGAFTGARKGGKQGLFELAHNGTIFLDEIGELSVMLQARLLRVLQNREVMRVGGDRLIPVDVRVVSATNRELKQAIAQGDFREDLYYRLNVLDLKIPSLRERREDIPLLARRFLGEVSRTQGFSANLPESSLQSLKKYDWPGNVRELENFVQKCVVLTQGVSNPEEVVNELIQELLLGRQQNGKSMQDNSLIIEVGTLEEMEQQIIKQLDLTSGLDRVQLSKYLGISRSTLWKKLKDGQLT
ncbi:sigma 54-interacting transcriptional regulator [Sporosarcina soli]|uniref:Sigma 54-interacting transcriptional regulator n=1 Tax=Sporosarcina soli TaxID=334736 RepID=A0ABW0TEG3_9BACL